MSSVNVAPVVAFSGCELNESNKEESFKTDDTNHQHQLALRTVGPLFIRVNGNGVGVSH